MYMESNSNARRGEFVYLPYLMVLVTSVNSEWNFEFRATGVGPDYPLTVGCRRYPRIPGRIKSNYQLGPA